MKLPTCCPEFIAAIKAFAGKSFGIGEGEISGSARVDLEDGVCIGDGWDLNLPYAIPFNYCPICGKKQETR